VAYDERLADRVRTILAAESALSERKMFGGLAFMLDGNMCCGIVADRLMLRLGADLAQSALERPHVHPMDFTGRPMTGMVYVSAEGIRGKALRPWVERAVGFVRTLPPKRSRADAH
jgi:TfoX/Sxy family transcriptional regulator of competence genes